MQIHQLKPKNKREKRKRVGRGGKKGTYSGKGLKGQKSRAGRKMMPIVREIIKRYPKLKGYRVKRFQNLFVVLNLQTLEKKYDDSSVINPGNLLEKKLIRRIKGRTPKVKILGTGDIKKKFTIENCLISASAKEKIEKAGGSVK